jgi:hypothetical protein
MPGKSVMVGPFQGGLNNVSLSGESKDSEVVELINMEVAEDTSLRSRPPFEYVPSTYIDGSTVGQKWQTLGIYRYSATEWYLICVKPTGASTADVIAVLNADFTVAPITIKSLTVTSVNKVNAFAQIDDVAYFLVDPSATISGFKWVKGGSTTDIAAMKKGKCMVSYKSRLWVAGANSSNLSSRMYFSAIDTVGYKPEVWNTDDYFDVAAGEGGFITALLPLNSNILVFKNDGTWRFSYPSAPKNGQVDKVSGSIGAANDRCVLEFENYVYVYDQGRFYELVNSTYTHLNRFVRFALDSKSVDGVAPDAEISLVNRRIVVRYFNTLYVYSIDTRSWSQWRSWIGTPGRFIELPADSNSTESSVYIAPSQGTTQNLGDNQINAFSDAYRAYIQTNIGTGTVSFAANTISVTTTSGTTTAYLNNTDGIDNYNLRVASGQKFRLTGTVNRTGAAPVARMTYLLNTGATSTIDTTLDLVAVDKTFTPPAGAIAANLHIRQTGAGTYSMLSMSLYRNNVTAAMSLIKLKDEYRSTPLVVEYIDCLVRTKSYDYKAPASIKRLFWWAADLKTSRKVVARMIPVSVKKRPTWGELQSYTHLQLQAGTWGNPLSFLEVILDINDGADPSNDLTENGRILMKFQKSIRFKQVSFELQLSSLGNEGTGPAKIHTLITFVLPKEKVTERTN